MLVLKASPVPIDHNIDYVTCMIYALCLIHVGALKLYSVFLELNNMCSHIIEVIEGTLIGMKVR